MSALAARGADRPALVRPRRACRRVGLVLPAFPAMGGGAGRGRLRRALFRRGPHAADRARGAGAAKAARPVRAGPGEDRGERTRLGRRLFRPGRRGAGGAPRGGAAPASPAPRLQHAAPAVRALRGPWPGAALPLADSRPGGGGGGLWRLPRRAGKRLRPAGAHAAGRGLARLPGRARPAGLLAALPLPLGADE